MAVLNVSQVDTDAFSALPERCSVELADDALAPQLLKGDLVFFRRIDRHPGAVHGDLVLLRAENETYYVRVLRMGDDGVPMIRGTGSRFNAYVSIAASGLVPVGVSDGMKINTWLRRLDSNDGGHAEASV